MNVFYVYVYIDPRDGVPFYIGKGRDNRAYVHLTASAMQTGLDKGWFFYRKLRKLLASGTSPEIRFLCKELTEDQSFYWETFFIIALGRRDIKTGCLCNHTNGGDGPSHKGHQHSEETKALIAEKLREIRTGWVLSEETKQRIGDANRGRTHTDEARTRMSEGQKKRFARPEERAKIAGINRGRRHSAETRQKMSEAHKGKRLSVETRQRMSAANKNRKNSAASLAKQSATKWRKHWLKSGGTTCLNICKV